MIEVNNLTKSKIDAAFLKGLARKVLREENEKGLDLSIGLVGQKRIKELNKKYRRKDKATDVLSFRYDGSGELVICPGQVSKNAKKYRLSFKQELSRVLIHGIFHLIGYSHKTMAGKQDRYIRILSRSHGL